MKRFKFRLDKMLAIKEYNELNAKLKYASKLQEKFSIEDENKRLENYIFEKINSTASNDILTQASFSDIFLKKIKLNKEKLYKVNNELNERFKEYREARKEKKTFEHLKENEQKRYKKELNRYQTKLLDDMSSQMFMRNRVDKKI